MKFMKIMNVINVTSVKIFDRLNPFFQEATFDGRLFINHVSNMTKLLWLSDRLSTTKINLRTNKNRTKHFHGFTDGLVPGPTMFPNFGSNRTSEKLEITRTMMSLNLSVVWTWSLRGKPIMGNFLLRGFSVYSVLRVLIEKKIGRFPYLNKLSTITLFSNHLK